MADAGKIHLQHILYEHYYDIIPKYFTIKLIIILKNTVK